MVKMDISIIIVNWNTRDLLDRCLKSVLVEINGLDNEIFIVDNASTDGSVEMIRSRYPQVNLIVNEDNPGFACANNLAIRQSTGKHVMLLNPDTFVRPGAVATLIGFLEDSPRAGMAGARLLNADGSLQTSAYPEPNIRRELWRLFHLDILWAYANYPMHTWELKQARQVDVLMGACVLLPRQALDDAGLFDEDYFMYSEEVDLCHRLRQKGWSLFWVPQAEVIHYGGQSTQQAAEEMFLRLYQGKILYFRKHHSGLAVGIYKLILLLASLSRLVLTPLAYLEGPSKRERHLKLSSNYLRLIGSLPGY
jgi:GT2 family glycosyltransferase